ncbi:MAG: hypothetical protein KKB08_09335 [Gammaproteobacteria bacterium]|nr:hypothetical protein [Gammaproteobacteria bacterium]
MTQGRIASILVFQSGWRWRGVSLKYAWTLMLDEQIKALPVVDALGNSKG